MLANSGPYGASHLALDQLLDSIALDLQSQDNVRMRQRLRVVHECEEAKRWLDLQSTQGDFHSVRVAENDKRAADCAEAIEAIDKLIQIDNTNPYFLRHAFSKGLALTVAEPNDLNVWLPDANKEAGGERFEASDEAKRFVENQFAFRSALFSLDKVLEAARQYLENWTDTSLTPWNWLGNLCCKPSLSRKSRSRITKDGDSNLGVAVLGLSIALSSMFRMLTAGQHNQSRWVGETVPQCGRPCWEIVADYVNCAFPSMSTESAESIRQRCFAFSKGRKVNIHNWTGAAVRQPQVQEK